MNIPAYTPPPAGQRPTQCMIDGCTSSLKVNRGLCQNHQRWGKHNGWFDAVALPKRSGVLPKRRPAPAVAEVSDEYIAKLERQLRAARALRALGDGAPNIELVADVTWDKDLRAQLLDLAQQVLNQHWPILLAHLRSEAGL